MTSAKNLLTICSVISCPDGVGIVAAVTQHYADMGGSLIESNHHTDVENKWFYMRNVIVIDADKYDLQSIRNSFSPLAEKFSMKWHIRDFESRQKMVILASHASHCLADLLYRWQTKELPCEISCVISNHENLRSMVEWHGIPFHYVPIDKNNKQAGFDKTSEIIERHNAQSIVLARYMQILPAQMCEQYRGKLINIHHSFLPSFIGADPYAKAFERGVKLIGATSHYVTEDLDEGPIIEQDVIRVNHSCTLEDMKRLGRDVEKAVLARGLRYHLEDRVIVKGNKTVIFE
ncbi:formyltetrahydrofolate deformylase [Thalassotalea crassostreae]|uniref:formyltetrahydrofolate deformylase n=1 Tax=Thalassotalea crassostreae TaxID=1763536 RepID=UPI0008387E81|nr:formyltetrahydrofolate deformylase [Thalassotalea crassostreae]